MALKPDQKIIADDINLKCASAQTKGVLMCFSSTAGYVEKKSNPSGAKIAGVLMVDVRNRDVRDVLGKTSTVRNYSKNEVPISGVLRLCRIGELLTNDVDASDTFAQGDELYVTSNGQFSKVQDNSGCEKVGHAIAAKDSDGYLRVWVNVL